MTTVTLFLCFKYTIIFVTFSLYNPFRYLDVRGNSTRSLFFENYPTLLSNTIDTLNTFELCLWFTVPIKILWIFFLTVDLGF